MGTWSFKLYGNDTTCDVRDIYIGHLRSNISDEDAYNMTYQECIELFNTDEEPWFWFAMADTQWKLGRLDDFVKTKVTTIIDSWDWNEWCEENELNLKKFTILTEELKAKLNTEMPKRKVFRKPRIFETSPWNIGDFYAYQFHSKKDISKDFYGKYIVFQKIGEHVYDKSWTSVNQLVMGSVIQIYNKVFSSCPTVSDIVNVDILPLVNTPKVADIPIEDYYIPSFDRFTKARMKRFKASDFPEKYFTFIGNSPLQYKEYKYNECYELTWEPTGMEDWIITWYTDWQNYNANT